MGISIDEHGLDRLRAAREKQGLTRQALAVALGCHPSTIVQIERGEKRPSAAMLDALCGELGLSWEPGAAKIKRQVS